MKDADPVTFGDLRDINDSIEVILEMLTLKPGGPWHWGMLHPEAQEQLWAQLFSWVSWLEDRYLRHLPRDTHPLPVCWYRHPVAVELLTALMVAHIAVYQEAATIASSALVDWHERCLWPTVTRLRDGAGVHGCVKAKKHTAEDLPREPVSDVKAFEAFRAEAIAPPTAAGDVGA